MPMALRFHSLRILSRVANWDLDRSPKHSVLLSTSSMTRYTPTWLATLTTKNVVKNILYQRLGNSSSAKVLLKITSEASLSAVGKKVKLVFRVDLKKAMIYLTRIKGTKKYPMITAPLIGKDPFASGYHINVVAFSGDLTPIRIYVDECNITGNINSSVTNIDEKL